MFFNLSDVIISRICVVIVAIDDSLNIGDYEQA
jgi:hypothetical protein